MSNVTNDSTETDMSPVTDHQLQQDLNTLATLFSTSKAWEMGAFQEAFAKFVKQYAVEPKDAARLVHETRLAKAAELASLFGLREAS